MKPSEVTVLSEKVEAVPSLLALDGDLGPEDALIAGGEGLAPDPAFMSSTLADFFAERVEVDPVFLTSVRRGGEAFCPSGALEPRRLRFCRGSSSVICAIAAASGGRFEFVERRPTVTLSVGCWSSERRLPALIVAAIRVPGEFSRLDASRLDAVLRSSGGGALGSTGDARDASRASGEMGCFGLVFEREPLPGIDTCGADLVRATGDLGGVPSCGFSLVLGEAWLRAGGGAVTIPRALSRSALISGGGGTLCTVITACQSAGGIKRASLALGGRQQPGQPGFWAPGALTRGLALAHLQ